MSVFVDTGLFVAQQNRRDAHHEAAREALDHVLDGRMGRPFTSDFVFDEALTVTRTRTRSHNEAMTVANRILGRNRFPHVFDMLMVTGPIFRHALSVYETYSDKPLSFTDATTVSLVQRRRIDHVLSFDDDFDGVVPRIDPRHLPES